MKTRILRYFKHLGLSILVLLLILIPVGISEGAQVSYGHDATSLNFDGEGPYVFYKNDSLVTLKYIRGNKDDGFATVWTSGCICVEPYADYPLKDSPFNRNTDKVEMN